MQERKRLQISPFNPDLLSAILPQGILQHATNISFHAIQTSPDRNYGYVDLPTIDAEKLKKKLNGSILKGSKMRVEDARPEKVMKRVPENAIPLEDSSIQTVKRGRRKEERSDGVIPGVELPEGRKVQRGWTEPAAILRGSKAPQRKKNEHDKKPTPLPSSFTTESECLFKTKLPPNAANDTPGRKRKRDHSSRHVVVHEFANTKKHPTFLKDNQGPDVPKHASEYAEDKGWVDKDGIVLEGRMSHRPRLSSRKSDNTESTRKSGRDPHSKYAQESSKLPSIRVSNFGRAIDIPDPDATSSSGMSSSSESETEGERTLQPPKSNPCASKESIADPLGDEASSSDDYTVAMQARGMAISRSSPKPPTETNDISSEPVLEHNIRVDETHPLETLFKKPKTAASSTPRKPTLEVSTSFNFFAPDVEEGNDSGLLMPHTPFTQQDFRQRRQRSAAPTPDTAAPGRSFENMWAARSESDDENDDDENDDEVDDAKKTALFRSPVGKEHNDANEGSGEKPESEFSKWFWEHRGETNRAWKRRRREATKEKRQKENKKK